MVISGSAKGEDAATDAGGLQSGTPCPSGLDRAGRCEDDRAVFCGDGSRVVVVDCPSAGEVCQLEPNQNLFVCLPPGTGLPATAPPRGAPCPEALDERGVCYGATVIWCSGGDVVDELDCASVGAGCGMAPSGKIRDCIDPYAGFAPGDTCPAGLTSVGHCLGDVLRWCTPEGTMQLIQCNASGGMCAYDDDARQYDCAPDPDASPAASAAPSVEACGGAPGLGAGPGLAVSLALLALLRGRTGRQTSKSERVEPGIEPGVE